MSEPIINGIDVSECCYYIQDYQRANNIEGRYEHCKDVCELNGNNYFYCKMNKDCYFKQLKRLQEENEKIKKQYNCYACGNCNGKEDYINLEKHHKGLRKQFDELAKRNNTLSLRIEELEKENEKLKEKNKELLNLCNNGGALLATESAKTKKYKQALEEIRKIAEDAYNNNQEYQATGVYNEILDKINEAFGNE